MIMFLVPTYLPFLCMTISTQNSGGRAQNADGGHAGVGKQIYGVEMVLLTCCGTVRWQPFM